MQLCHRKTNFNKDQEIELKSSMINLTLQRPMFPSYRNQSVDLFRKSTDWFLYDGNIGR